MTDWLIQSLAEKKWKENKLNQCPTSRQTSLRNRKAKPKKKQYETFFLYSEENNWSIVIRYDELNCKSSQRASLFSFRLSSRAGYGIRLRRLEYEFNESVSWWCIREEAWWVLCVQKVVLEWRVFNTFRMF